MLEKMMVYNMREFDERPFFTQYAADYGFEIVSTPEKPTPENAYLADGCRYVNVITTPIDRALLERFHAQGTTYLVTRTIGYDHIDQKAAAELGIQIANTPYGPDGVAEYTLLLMLMCIRKMKSIQQRFAGQDFTLNGLIGRELSDMTVGIVGTGRIGTRLCEILSGFGCRILAYAPHPNPTAEKNVTYVPMQTLLQESDILSLHVPATADTVHMINNAAIAQMKHGVVLVNTARGALLDTDAVIQGLDNGTIGGVGLDVIEDESTLFYYDRREDILCHPSLYRLRSYPNVIITHHMAFYTHQCVETMVRDSLHGAACTKNGMQNPWLV